MPTRILGLDIGAASVKAVLVEAHFRKFEIQQCVTQRVPSPEEVAGRAVPESVVKFRARRAADNPPPPPVEGAEPSPPVEEPIPPVVWALVDLLRRPGLAYDEIVCAVAGGFVATRILKLPFSGRSKINQVLPMTIEDEVPFDMDEMVLSYEILHTAKDGATVLAAMAKRDDVARLLEWLEMAGIEPKALTMTGSALSVTAAHVLAGVAGASAVVDIGEQSTDAVIMNDGRIALVRSIPEGGEEVTANLARALGIDAAAAERLKVEAGRILAGDDESGDARVVKLSHALVDAHQLLLGRLRQTIRSSEMAGQFKIKTLYLTGGASRLPGFAEHLSRELGVPVEPFPSLSPRLPSLVEADDEKNRAYGVAIGAAVWTAPSNRARAVNFRQGAFAYHKVAQAVQGSLKGAAVMAGIVIALFIVLVLQSRSVQAKRIAALDQQARKIYLDTFTQQPPPGSIVQAFRTQADQVIQKYKVIGLLGEGNLRALDVMRAMSEALTKEVEIEVVKLDLKPEFVKIEAVTDKFETVNKIETELGKRSDVFKSVNRDEAKKTAGDKIKFKLTMQLVQKAKSASGVTTLFGGGQPASTPVIPGSEP